MKIAKSLLAGAAIVALFPAYASAQEYYYIDNSQTQNKDIASTVIVNVPTVREINAYSIAAGNSSNIEARDREVEINLTQKNRGNVSASSIVTTYNFTRQPIKSLAVAGGNAGSAKITGGSAYGKVNQYSGETNKISAYSNVYASSAKNVKSTALANGNSFDVEAKNTQIDLKLTQTNHSGVSATSILQGDRNTYKAESLAVANGNSSSWSGQNSNLKVDLNQTNNGKINAYSEVTLRSANNISSIAAAAGNNVDIKNKLGYTQVSGSQLNKKAVNAVAIATVDNWSGKIDLAAQAYGNSVTASNKGGDVGVYLTQTNNGPISATALFTGGSLNGGVVNASSQAIGNAFSGFTCSTCKSAANPAVGGKLTQINNGNVQAFTSVVGGTAGKITASAIAIGNSASFIAQRGK